jgi:hypothetical protein
MIQSRFILLLLLLLSCSKGFPQTDSIIKRINNSVSENLKEQKHWSEKIREGIYYEKGFERYKGKIEKLDINTIRYDSLILKVHTARAEYNSIFEQGIFHPGIFAGDQSGGKVQPGGRPDSATAFGNCFTHYNVIGVSVLDEIKPERNTYTSKRFRIWQWLCAFANPREYIFDLENKLADEKTSLEEFIKGSKLTYIRFVTIII